MNEKTLKQAPPPSTSAMDKFLNGIERAGNKIPDPALLFFWGLVTVWVLSAVLSQFDFGLVLLMQVMCWLSHWVVLSSTLLVVTL
jgi:p-aminobenzoyl-glutamate transporter AbgT